MNVKKVAIASYELAEYRGESSENDEEFIFKLVKSALAKAKISHDEIDAVYTATTDMNDGITISCGCSLLAAGGYYKDSCRVENGAVFAIISACAAIQAELCSYVVVASVDAVTSDAVIASNLSYEPFIRRPIGLNYINTGAMVANSYMNKYHVTEYDYALVAAKNYKAAIKNPYAHVRKGYSVEEILDSPVIAWPLREHEICPMSYGGAALVLTTEDKAKRSTDNPIYITGFGMGSEPYFGDWDEVVKMQALRHASRAAYKMAGIKDPRKEINIAEVFNPLSPLELLEYEALGFCEDGHGIELVREGITDIDGELPVNMSGGTLSTHGANSGGLFRTIYSAMCLKNELPELKSNAKKAIVCDSDLNLGFPGGTHAVLILERNI